MTETNWPNPERPGVPMFPERDGLHAIRTPLGTEFLVKWDCSTGRLLNLSGSLVLIDRLPKLFYIGPCLTPTQISEMMAGERERCADVCRAMSFDNAYEKPARATLEVAETAIRNLGAAS